MTVSFEWEIQFTWWFCFKYILIGIIGPIGKFQAFQGLKSLTFKVVSVIKALRKVDYRNNNLIIVIS